MQSIAVIAIALMSTAGLACSAASPSAEDADARIGTVQEALVAPTGSASSESLKTLLTHWRAFQRVRAAFDALLFVQSDLGKACLSGSQEAGAYDLSCLTHGQVRGRIAFQSHGSSTKDGFQGRVDAKLENACVGGDCVSADALVNIVPSPACAALATIAVTANVSGEAPDSFAFGGQGGIGRGQLMAHVAYFDADDRSLVVDGEGETTAPGPYLVSGSNRSFECTFLANGGKCEGATSFVF